MSPEVLTGFAGVLVAAVATGMLAGRCVRQPRIGFVVWTAAALVLTIALAAQSMGFASGFGPATFRAVSLFALLLAPLWLAWGLVEVAVANDTARFGARLVASALTVVATVILATDPLTAAPFSKAWPLAATHFQPVALDALDVVQVVAVVAVVVTAGLTAVRVSRGSGRPVMVVVPVVVAVLVTAGQRLPLPADAVYPLLSMMAAALTWFAVSRLGEPSRRAAARGERNGGRGEGVRDASGKPGDDYWPDDRAAGDYVPEGQYVTYGQDRPGPDGRPGPARPRGDFPGRPPARPLPEGNRGRRPGPPPRPPERPDRYRGSGPPGSGQRGSEPRGSGELATDERAGTQPVPALGSEGGAAESGLPAGTASAPGTAGGAAARPYGRILIFTLLEDRAADFDRLAEETAEQVRTGEPDTLVYVIHLVPNAPLQRIFYEIYRDRAAFDSHESQPYMQRFVAERRAFVLATNMIELRLKYAKVAPLPSPQPAAPALLPAVAATPQPGVPAAPPRGVPGPPVPQRGRPLPPPRPQRPDQPRYDQPGYAQPGYGQPGYGQPRYDQARADRERYDEWRRDQRQVPSGRPYGG
jgi:quinol monooxygenase YgiN